MKRLIKFALRLTVLLVIGVVAFFLTKDRILRRTVEEEIRAQTGMNAKIGRLSTGLFSPVVTIENLKLYNTAEFGGTPFLEVPELYLEIDRQAVSEGKVRLALMRLNISEFDV